ncbi:MAG: tRNA (adenosine(37)-N6)-threonylcarbamoyltransferase complex ATPase subunit type 1 TsaE [Bacteroidota bacterium]
MRVAGPISGNNGPGLRELQNASNNLVPGSFINLLTFAANSINAMAEWEFTLDQLPDVAGAFRQQFVVYPVIAFHGEMGAGKTTFIHAICKAMRVNTKLSSPTFSIINEYSYDNGTVYHIDLYRLNNDAEAIRAGVEECIYSGNTCLVEWPERAPGIFPAATLHVYLEATDGHTRRMRVADK